VERACLILFLLCIGTASAATPHENKISNEQAKALIIASLAPQQRRLPKLEAVPDDASTSSEFLFFTVSWEGMQSGSVVVGNYAVDPYTGDVFSSTRECYEEKNSNLAILQTQVRSAIRLSPSEYLRLKSRGPLCGK
jgi:hypothetical protein